MKTHADRISEHYNRLLNRPVVARRPAEVLERA
jgi:hypothetical protein